MTMKILYHHRIVSKDGQFVHLEELTNALIAQGHEIRFVGPKIVESDNFGSDGGIVPFLKKYIPQVLYELLELSYSIYDFIKLIITIVQFKPDVIYERYNLFFISGIWAKKITKLPFILEVNSPLYEERAKFNKIGLKKLAHWTERYVWKNADYTLPVTQVLADIIYQETSKKNQIVIHNGINTKKFNQPLNTEKLKAELGLKNKFVLGFTGFVRDWHKIEQVLDVISEYNNKNLVLLLVGDGPARETLIAYAKKINIEDSFIVTGIISRDQINHYVDLFDVALQPAVTPYASPLKMFEYLALGKLIVAPDKDNIKEILQNDYNAIFFDKNKQKSFKNALVKAIELKNKEVFYQNARKTIKQKKFTWDDNAKRVTQLFNKLLTLKT